MRFAPTTLTSTHGSNLLLKASTKLTIDSLQARSSAARLQKSSYCCTAPKRLFEKWFEKLILHGRCPRKINFSNSV
jgi:hypothetical protein